MVGVSLGVGVGVRLGVVLGVKVSDGVTDGRMRAVGTAAAACCAGDVPTKRRIPHTITPIESKRKMRLMML
jgi:hypothetical protein